MQRHPARVIFRYDGENYRVSFVPPIDNISVIREENFDICVSEFAKHLVNFDNVIEPSFYNGIKPYQIRLLENIININNSKLKEIENNILYNLSY